MYFKKMPHPANFEFLQEFKPGQPVHVGKSRVTVDVERYAGDMYRISCRSPLWKKKYSQAELKLPRKLRAADPCATDLVIDTKLGLRLTDEKGHVLLASPGGRTFGLSGNSSMFQFHHDPKHQYYGMGEKMLGLELSGVSTKFWNTDVLADFHWGEVTKGRPDPLYVSIPYVIIKEGNRYVGLLLDNPHATFMSTAAEVNIEGQMKVDDAGGKTLIIGAEHGQSDLYVIVGPTLAELTRKLQCLVGVTPLPPVWALGYHQCRWGYQSAADMEWLDREFTENKIPCDGLWLDIDYMDSFKVFTFNRKHFKNVRKTLKELKSRGRRVVPIIDPGVKQQPGYDVYDSGMAARAFCENQQGTEYIGLVWPGRTAFPDFSINPARKWWAEHVEKFARKGIEGAWLDMNDPSTGEVLCTDMLFDRGKDNHYTYHNQYALGMAKATREGFQAARPKDRVFLISRSGFTGISKYSAIWTGDNVSNYHYLRNCIAVSMNLALSGVPFNGPDVGGFACDAMPELMVDWQKCCFLFPFCRNHTVIDTRQQEPWAFGKKVMRILRHYIRLRYKLRPYLYNLFVQQEEMGEAILRPLFYEFRDTKSVPLGHVDDEFMVGPAILQAPVLAEDKRDRDVLLPGKKEWYSALDAKWVKAGRRHVLPKEMESPIYFREGTMVPMTVGDPTDNAFDGRRIELHVFLHKTSKGKAEAEYVFDDGQTLAYKQGKRSRLRVVAQVKKGVLHVDAHLVENGFGDCDVTFVLYDEFKSVVLNGAAAKTRTRSWKLAGVSQGVWNCR